MLRVLWILRGQSEGTVWTKNQGSEWPWEKEGLLGPEVLQAKLGCPLWPGGGGWGGEGLAVGLR